MSQYKTGTVSVTNGSATVTGSGTAWSSNVSPGDGFVVAGTSVPYTVASVSNNTSLTLSTPYQGSSASGESYAIWRDFTTNESLPELSQGDIETATLWTRALRKIDAFIGTAYKRSNILGTVSQSSGVPTGAIIERGSNSNGGYVKLADGTMICHINILYSDMDVTEAHGVLYSSPEVTVTFPAQFSTTLDMADSSTPSGSDVVSCIRQGTYKGDQMNIRVLSASSAVQTLRVTLLVTGRWY